jgi:chromosomal replication initiator protein
VVERSAQRHQRGLCIRLWVSMSEGNHSITELDDAQKRRWKNIQARLRAQLGERLYNSWFSRLEFRAMDGGEATLIAPTSFMKMWIDQHYLDQLQAEFSLEFDDIRRISIVARPSSSA